MLVYSNSNCALAGTFGRVCKAAGVPGFKMNHSLGSGGGGGGCKGKASSPSKQDVGLLTTQ